MDKFTKQISTVSMNIEPMSLKFFAYHFMINEEYLQYGIVEETNRKTGKKERIAAILIKGHTNSLVNKGWLTVFINVCKDYLASNISDSQYGYELFPAEFSEENEDFCFRYKKCVIRLNKRMMKEFYLYKVFWPSVGLIAGAVPEMFEDCWTQLIAQEIVISGKEVVYSDRLQELSQGEWVL